MRIKLIITTLVLLTSVATPRHQLAQTLGNP